MTRDEFLRGLEKQLECEPGSLKGDEVLADLEQWDSLRALGFVVWVKKTTGVVVDGAKIAKAKTVADLASLLNLI